MSTYLTNRTFVIEMDGLTSKSFKLPCGVPQGSSLSPTLFNIYVAPLAAIIRQCSFSVVSYADDTQVVVSVSDNIDETADRFNFCMSQINFWMRNNCLKWRKNGGSPFWFKYLFLFPKMAARWFGRMPNLCQKVRNLGVVFDERLTFEGQINKLASTFWGILKMIRKIRPFIPLDALKTVVTALALSRLDYGNALYVGLQSQLLLRLQRMQNAAARLILDIPKSESVSHRLRDRVGLRKAVLSMLKSLNSQWPGGMCWMGAEWVELSHYIPVL